MLQQALSYYRQNREIFLKQLIQLVKIPSVSFEGFDPTQVQKSAEYTAQLLKEAGLENVEILKIPGTHPYIYADWLHAPNKPTLLLYAHHDVQPPMDESRWKSKPFEPETRNGRLYGRGAADDKAGVLIHVASISSFLKSCGELPVNVKVIIEGEEEIGSHHLPEFLNRYKKKLAADVMVLTDLANFDTGLPSLTTSLRGLVAIELSVKSIDHPLHSGLWSGPIPDPNMAMAKILGSLTDANGNIVIKGMLADVLKVRKDELKDFNSLPLNEKTFREQSGMLKKSKLVGGNYAPRGRDAKHPSGAPTGGKKHLLELLWRQPSLVINWLESGSKKTTGNVIMNQSQARIGIRIVPNQNAKKVLKQLTGHIKKVAPWGMSLEFKTESCSDPWVTDTQHPVFKIAKDALTAGYGRDACFTGCGASIPFVAPFSKALGNIPALLVGIEDPYTNAHGENESLDLGDFEKAIKSQIYLFEKISTKSGRQS